MTQSSKFFRGFMVALEEIMACKFLMMQMIAIQIHSQKLGTHLQQALLQLLEQLRALLPQYVTLKMLKAQTVSEMVQKRMKTHKKTQNPTKYHHQLIQTLYWPVILTDSKKAHKSSISKLWTQKMKTKKKFKVWVQSSRKRFHKFKCLNLKTHMKSKIENKANQRWILLPKKTKQIFTCLTLRSFQVVQRKFSLIPRIRHRNLILR